MSSAAEQGNEGPWERTHPTQRLVTAFVSLYDTA
jgi:hypothetical protein